jgi:uncharacterized protein YndB with AHSA1/START domain
LTALSINKSISIAASPEAIYDALTNSDSIVKYFPLKSVISDWKVGEEVYYIGEANGTPFTDFGTIEILDRPSQYKYSYWSDNHGTARTHENLVSIRYQIKSYSNYCTVNLTQENIPTVELYEAMNNSIWGLLLKEFKTFMESPTLYSSNEQQPD